MAEPYSIFKRSNGIYYVQFPCPGGGKSFQKSTGCRTRAEANRKVLEWYAEGGVIPERTNAASPKEGAGATISIEKRTFFTNLRTMEFDGEDRDRIIRILKERKLIVTAVVPQSRQAVDATDFFTSFWDYDASPYVKELLSKGRQIHRSYTETNLARIRNYWLPRIRGRTVGELTRRDIEGLFTDKKVENLASKTVNAIIGAVVIPLKWAYARGYTEDRCYEGISKLPVKSRKRKILSQEEAERLFMADWENDAAKLANDLARHTGMRAGEIAGLRKRDIGDDELNVNHSWSRYDGLKSCKNGEGRWIPIPIPHYLCVQLRYQAELNPYGEGEDGFVFFGLKPQAPTDTKNWTKYLHRALAAVGHAAPDEICFHSWRHFFCSRMMDKVSDKRIVMAVSGHKSEQMLDHYAEHLEQNRTVEAVRKAMKEVFGEEGEKVASEAEAAVRMREDGRG